MRYLFNATRAIPELGASPGDTIVLSPLAGAAAVTVVKEHGAEKVWALLRRLDSLEALPCPSEPHPVLPGPEPYPLERCLDPTSGSVRPASRPEGLHIPDRMDAQAGPGSES